MKICKRNGFTLVELLVAMTLATFLLGSISASLYSVISLSTSVMHDSASDFQIVTLKDYVISKPDLDNQSNGNDDYLLVDTNYDIHHFEKGNERIILKDTIIQNIVFDMKSNESDAKKFKTCTFEFIEKENRKPFTFVVCEIK